VWCVWSEGSFSSYTLQWRLLAELRMETPGTNFRRIRSNLPPKCTWTGAYPGPTNPRGRPTPRWAPWPPPSRGALIGGSLPYPLGACHLYMSVCPTMWAFLVRVAQDTIFCAFLLRLLHVFLLHLLANTCGTRLL
jgi:hypothetical protein